MNVSSTANNEQLEHLIDASDAITLKATFQLMAGMDHKEVLRELDLAHEELWNSMGNQDLLLPMVARALNDE